MIDHEGFTGLTASVFDSKIGYINESGYQNNATNELLSSPETMTSMTKKWLWSDSSGDAGNIDGGKSDAGEVGSNGLKDCYCNTEDGKCYFVDNIDKLLLESS